MAEGPGKVKWWKAPGTGKFPKNFKAWKRFRLWAVRMVWIALAKAADRINALGHPGLSSRILASRAPRQHAKRAASLIKADRAPGGVFGFEGCSLLLRRLVTAAYSGVVFSTFRLAS